MRHKFQSSPSRGSRRLPSGPTPTGQLSITLVLLLLSVGLAACSTTIPVHDSAMRYDFFYTPEGIRITGHAKMPPGGIDLTYQERKDQCLAQAKRQADSKWLGVTEKTIELQSLWLDRLNRGAKGPWQKCLDQARILRFMPESAEACSIIVLYTCDPQKW